MSIPINPNILVWARQSAGLTIDDAAEKLALSTTAKSSAAEKLVALETGQTQPTRSQLNSFANVYKRPLLTFYLSEPPRKATAVKTLGKPQKLVARVIMVCWTRFCATSKHAKKWFATYF
jgi:transcriptional regulator with XRE-family HTH domain